MSHHPVRPHTRLEHIEVDTPAGRARMLVMRYYDASHISGSTYGLDWWRTPEAPKKSRMRRVLDVLLRTTKKLDRQPSDQAAFGQERPTGARETTR